ncbi:MAG: hypothetical protein GY870_13385 [archaeon]|nr:hypothetical protein [archaeon]
MVKNEENTGKVSIINGRYKPQGKFHIPEKNEPIFNKETGKLAGITNPRDMTYIHSYGGEAVFFESLSKGKLMASKCENEKCDSNNSIFEPFRIHCPDCLKKATAIDITDKARKSAKIYSFIITERTGAFNTLKIPIKFINIEFEEVCTILMSYLSVGEPKIGQRVIPIFRTINPTYTIVDLSWVVEGTKEEDLPDGFTF